MLTRFRSLWGIEPGHNLESWIQLFPGLKKQGYIDIHGLNPDRELKGLRELCDTLDFEISVTLFSSWPQYSGPRPNGLTAENHLKMYSQQLEQALLLKPAVINVQSGEDAWSLDESVKFYQGTLKVDKDLGITGLVCHETHRNRSLFNPFITHQILKAVPQLQITADFSHWMLGCERLLDIGEGDRAMMDAIIPHVYHIHARIGTTQASQCPDPTNPVFTEERLCMERLWTKIIQHRISQEGQAAKITLVPEYGPFPYHPFQSTKAYGTVADEEGARLEALFKGHFV